MYLLLLSHQLKKEYIYIHTIHYTVYSIAKIQFGELVDNGKGVRGGGEGPFYKILTGLANPHIPLDGLDNPHIPLDELGNPHTPLDGFKSTHTLG